MFQSDGCIIHSPSPSAFSNASRRALEPGAVKKPRMQETLRALCQSFLFIFACSFFRRHGGAMVALPQEGCGFDSGPGAFL